MSGGREAVVRAATKLFAEKGFSATSTREICAGAGITKPVLYYHFRSKEHLYQELMIDCFSRQDKALLALSKERGALRDRLVQVLYNDFREVKSDPAPTRMILRSLFAPDEEPPVFDCVEEMKRKRRTIAEIFQEGIAAGEVHGEPLRLATALIGISTIAILEYLFTGRKVLTRRSAEKYVDLMLDGCRQTGFEAGTRARRHS